MITTEQQVLDAGFDFASSVHHISQRFPTGLEWSVPGFEVVRFRLDRSFADLGDCWNIPIHRPVERDLPPLRYNCEFHPTRDARINHERAVAQLAALLGTGSSGTSANVYQRNWRVGCFEIRVLTWPRELNSFAHNCFAAKNPNLGISANVSIEPDFPFIEPVPDPLLRPFLQDPLLTCHSQVYGRRCLATAAEAVAGLTVDSFVIRDQGRMVIVPLPEIQGAVLTRLTPGRYPGSSTLTLHTLFLNRHAVRVTVAKGTEPNSLDNLARALSSLLSTPLDTEEYSDDG